LAFLKTIASKKSDTELIEMYKQSEDLNVVAELFQRYIELVYGVCLKYLKVPEDAQDSTINIFEELSGKLLKHDVDNFKAWLYTLAKNHCLMRLRSEKKQVFVKFDAELVQSDESLHLNGMLEKEDNFRKLEYCLEKLASDQRRVIELFYLEHRCYNEITELTGLEWNKVRSYIQNGRRNLKLCIEAQKAKSMA
jgi:RNA polymerase sigma-70 factor (ECF subfamily)